MSQRSKIVIGVGDLLGCGYYRCAMPYKHLSKLGFEVILTNKLNVELNPKMFWSFKGSIMREFWL